jgi:hypothetical protein
VQRYSACCLTTIAWYQLTAVRGHSLMAGGSASALLLQGVSEPHDLVLQGIDGCLGAVGQLQFRQNVGDMRPDRGFADYQCTGNLLVRAAPRQVGQHLQFSRRQILEGGCSRWRISWRTRAATSGWSMLSPRAALHTASTRSWALASLSRYERAPALIALKI